MTDLPEIIAAMERGTESLECELAMMASALQTANKHIRKIEREKSRLKAINEEAKGIIVDMGRELREVKEHRDRLLARLYG